MCNPTLAVRLAAQWGQLLPGLALLADQQPWPLASSFLASSFFILLGKKSRFSFLSLQKDEDFWWRWKHLCLRLEAGLTFLCIILQWNPFLIHFAKEKMYVGTFYNFPVDYFSCGWTLYTPCEEKRRQHRRRRAPHVGRGLNEWKSQYRIKWRWTHAFFNYEVLRQHFLYSSVDEA